MPLCKLVFVVSGCDVDSPRRPGPNGGGGDEARDQCSPLHLCCTWGLENTVTTLLEHGAYINCKVSLISNTSGKMIKLKTVFDNL